MTLAEAAALAADETFQGRVRVMAVQYALVVLAETPTSNNTVDDKRSALAVQTVADGCQALLPRFAYGVASIAGFAADPGDEDINSAMGANWSKFAGVVGRDVA